MVAGTGGLAYMNWTERSVVISGAAMGIGRHIALGAAARGASVAIGDIDQEGLQQVAEELRSFGNSVVAIHTDVQIEDEVHRLMETTFNEFGSIDYLVNNAAIVPHFSWGGPRWPKVRDMDLEFWSEVIGTNLQGSFLCSKHAIPFMERQGSGHIVNLYGGGGPTPPGGLAYVVTKEALVTLSQYLAEEVREHNICVMSVDPGGAIATERAPEEARARMPGPESVGDRFFLAAETGMEFSGHLVNLVGGELTIIR